MSRLNGKLILILFLFIVCVQLQYHYVAIAETYQGSPTINGSYTELVKKGNEAYKENRLLDAEIFFKSALKKIEAADVYINLGHVYMRQKKRDYAIDAYRSALQITQRTLKQGTLDSDNLILIGICFENMGNKENALNAFRNAVTLSPLSKEANRRLALALHNSSKLEESLEVYHYILHEWPDAIDVLINIGNIFLEMEKYDEAIDIFESAQRLGVGGRELDRTIADLYLSENMYKEASLSYQRFIKSSLTQSAEDYYRLANAYYMGGENHSACKALQKAIDENPDYVKAHLLMGDIFLEEMEPDKAMKEYERIIKGTPDMVIAHLALANLFTEKGEKEKAINEYRTVINLGQKDVAIFYNLIVILSEEGKYEESVQTVKEALRIHPQDNSLKTLLESIVGSSNSER